MLALRKLTPAFGLELAQVAAPRRPGPGEVVIDIAAAGICGSDLHVYEWTAGYGFMTDRMPLTLGHEFTGRVARIGDGVTGLRPGDPVTVWPTVGCGACFACLAGRRQDCQERQVIGLHNDGGFAEQVVVPAGSVLPLPAGADADLGLFALAEPLAVGQNALDVAAIEADASLVVLGPGPIGLGIAWLARKAGLSKVILAGYNDEPRLARAGRLGIEHRVDLAHETLEHAVTRIFGRPADVVIEATGAIGSIHEGLAVLRSSGIFVVAGIHSAPLEIDLTKLVRDKKQLRTAHDSTTSSWHRVLSLIAANRDEVQEMISHRLPLSAALEGFELARRGDAMKVLLEPARSV